MKSRFTLSLFLTVGLSSCVWMDVAQAGVPPTKDRPERNWDSPVESTPTSSRFKRRMDYRDEDKAKAADAEAQRKAAVAEQTKAEQAAINNAKKSAQASIDANNRGVALGQQHRWVESISAHEQACQLDPRNKQYRINLSAARTAYGIEKLRAGDTTSASSLFRKALAAANDNGLATKSLNECMKKQGKNPSDPDVRMEIGDQLCSIGDLESATVEYQAAMQLDPSARTFVKMGDMALRYGQVATAINWYQQAIVKEPNYGPAHRQLGLLAFAQKDFTSAAASLRKAVVMDPKDVAASQSLIEIWRRQVATNPSVPENHLGLAGALQLSGDFNGADGEYRQVEAIAPQNPGLAAGRASLQRAYTHAEADKRRAAAETLENQGLHREAMDEIKKALQMEPHNAKFMFVFAECSEGLGDYQAAANAYLTCVRTDPDNKEAAARLRDMQRNLPNQNQNQAQAANNQNDNDDRANGAMNNNGGNANFAANGNAGGYAQTGNQSQAQNPVSNQSTTGGGMNDVMSKVTSLEAERNLDGAIGVLRQALQADLKNPDVHHRLAVDLLAAGQITEAISEFRISSALRPANQDYAADLARAMAIHKRSLQSENGVAATQEGAH